MISRLIALFTLAGTLGFAAEAGSDAAAVAGPLDRGTLDRRTNAVMRVLKLPEPAQEAKTRAAVEGYFQALAAWHEAHDAQLRELWTRWADARGLEHKDEAKAAEIGSEIDRVYGDFRPKHDAFLAELKLLVPSEQIEALKNALTRSPGLERTYDAYLQIVPALKDDEKRFIREKLLIAREQAMDTFADKEKANLFKKQKVQIEAFIDAHGYDWKKSYAAFAAKVSGKKPETSK